jgi:hypothetical protein
MRHDFAAEELMSTFHRVDLRTVREDRLSRGKAAVVIAGLSALSWAVLISIILAIRETL